MVAATVHAPWFTKAARDADHHIRKQGHDFRYSRFHYAVAESSIMQQRKGEKRRVKKEGRALSNQRMNDIYSFLNLQLGLQSAHHVGLAHNTV